MRLHPSRSGPCRWVASFFSRGSSRLRDQTQVSCTASRLFTGVVGRGLDVPGPQPTMTVLFHMLKEHQAKQNERKKLQQKRREAITSATCLTEVLVDHLNVGVAQANRSQRKLDHKVKTLQIHAAQSAKQTGQWVGMVQNFNQALKEIGDVQNRAQKIELDVCTIATALEYIYKGQRQSAPSLPSCPPFPHSSYLPQVGRREADSP
ncbi:biogenesis of lysosome-related organelles complex 1 subunit 1-like isoform X2 [Moschus berezovskii]|uniref:biogenesis of lysosome-related organelles complex 1 subunit 1-like isoform X2 n=1 Tax=Moschus berezovskii TaxID=68408 RepID=UPI0024441550|nr:biogenesis of lysosome-related organelles complex 1 subunit 1-like isoform X2 [Moschus berezovskii]